MGAYKNSDEERDDVVKAYEKFKGSWRGIYESVMLSDPLEDEDRFRSYIDAAIASGDVKGFKIYTEESEKDKEKKPKGKKGKKRVSDEDEDDDDDEPSEEAFQAAAKKLKTGKAESEGRKSKRAKH